MKLTKSLLVLSLFMAVNLPPVQGTPSSKFLQYGNGAEPKDLDPHNVTGVPEGHIINALFEGLVQLDPKSLSPLPGVAESWNVSKNGLVYTFKLRNNAKWSNGEPVTANDFVYSWLRLLDPKTTSEYAGDGFYIKNGRKFNSGEIKDPSQVGVKALDGTTLEVTLENPTSYFIPLLYHYPLYPVPKAAIEKHGQRWTRPENIVSNGAFMMKSWEMNKGILAQKNPLYWDAANVKLDEVYFHAVEKPETEEKLFRSGKLHVTSTVPIEKIPQWMGDKTGVYQNHPYLGIYAYRINTTVPPLNKKEVRQALALALDREIIVTKVTRGGQKAATAFTPPGTGGFNPKAFLPKDGSQIGKARELLAKAGYPGGKGFPTLEFKYNTNEGIKKIAEATQQMWRKNLGINVELINMEWKVFLDNERTMNYQIARMGWIGDYNDPNTFLDLWVTNGGNNKTGWGKPEYDALIEQAATVPTLQKRFEAFQKAEALLMDELPSIPIYVYVRSYLKSHSVMGWYPNVQDIHPLKFVDLK